MNILNEMFYAWTLSTDQMPADKDNCRKADLCTYLGERNEGLAVENYSELEN